MRKWQSFLVALLGATSLSAPALATAIDLTVGVGAGFDFSTIATAVAAVNQDPNLTNVYTITIAPGTYTNDTFTAERSMSLVAETPGSVILNQTVDLPNQKGIILTSGSGIQLTVDGLTLEGAHIGDDLGANGAGIRDQSTGAGASLTVLNSTFINNEMGILQGDNADEIISVSNSQFINNGLVSPDPSLFGHGIYVNTAASLTVTNSEFCGQLVGHDIKSRAAATTVTGSTMYEGALDPNIPECRAGTTSLSVDAPNGGVATLTGNTMIQGAASQNQRMVDYGEEGLVHATNSFIVSDNEFTDVGKNAIGIYDPNCIPVQLSGNSFSGVETPVSPPECAVFDGEPPPGGGGGDGGATVPEPASLVMLVTGLLATAAVLRRRRG